MHVPNPMRSREAASNKSRPKWLRKIGASALALGVVTTGLVTGTSALTASPAEAVSLAPAATDGTNSANWDLEVCYVATDEWKNQVPADQQLANLEHTIVQLECDENAPLGEGGWVSAADHKVYDSKEIMRELLLGFEDSQWKRQGYLPSAIQPATMLYGPFLWESGKSPWADNYSHNTTFVPGFTPVYRSVLKNNGPADTTAYSHQIVSSTDAGEAIAAGGQRTLIHVDNTPVAWDGFGKTVTNKGTWVQIDLPEFTWNTSAEMSVGWGGETDTSTLDITGSVDSISATHFGVTSKGTIRVSTIPPTLVESNECGVESTIRTYDFRGLTYSQTREGNVVTVTAMPGSPWYPNRSDTTTWTFEIPDVVPCVEVTPEDPTMPTDVPCGTEAVVIIPKQEGVEFSQTREGNIVTVTASATEGFVIEDGVKNTWTFEIPEVVPCDEVVVPVAPQLGVEPVCGAEQDVVIPEQTGVEFTETREGNTVTVTASATEGFVIEEGATTVWTFEIPDVVPCDEVVVPVAPVLGAEPQCGVEQQVIVPADGGVVYTQTREGNIVTVTAAAAEGFVIEEGAQTVWTFEIPEVVACDEPVIPVAPYLMPNDECGVESTVFVPEQEGVEFTEAREGRTVTVTAAAAEGFVIAEGAQTSWTIEIPEVVACDEVVVPIAPELVPSDQCGVEGTVLTPETKGVKYTQTRDGNTVTVKAEALEGYVLAEGAKAEWTIEIPEVEACPSELIEVTPVTPTITESTECGVANTLELPTIEGVVYTVGEPDENGDFTITAEAADGYVIAEGAPIEWKANLGTVVPCEEPVDPEAPVAPEEPVDPEAPVAPEEPVVTDVKKGAVTGDPFSQSNGGLLVGGIAMVLAAAAGGFALLRRRGLEVSEEA